MYKTEIVSLSKKQLPVHKAEVKDDTKVQDSPEVLEKFKEEFRKKKSSNKREREIRGEILSLVKKLGENVALQPLFVYRDSRHMQKEQCESMPWLPFT